MSRSHHRITIAAVSGVAALAVALTGCAGGGSSSSSAGSDEKVTLRMVWWGDEVRADATTAAIEQFESENPNITVEAEPLPFDGYFDKLATQIAANDAPDVQQLAIDYVADYGTRGALLNLDKVNTDQLDPATTKAANVDGEQWGVATGLSTQVVVANKTLFDQAGVDLPDDKTWTWDDYVKIAAEITAKSPEGIRGAAPLGMDAISFQAFLRQEGAAAFDEDGKIAFGPDDMQAYLELAKKLQDSGGSAGPEVAAEQIALPLEQTGTATNTIAMGFWASGQYTALVNNSGQDLVPLRLPSVKSGDSQMSIGVSQYWGVSSRTKHPEQSQKLVDFMVNNEKAGLTLGLVRGTPPNSDVATALAAKLEGSDATITEFVTDVGQDAVTTPLPPAGFGSFQDVFRRYVAEYMFGRQSAEQASQGFVDEIGASYK